MKKFLSILSLTLIAGIAMLIAPSMIYAAPADGPHKGLRNGTGASNRISYERPVRKGRMKQQRMRRKAVTPYGDFCSRCSKYGMGKKPVTPKEAVAAMQDYFKRKDLTVKNIHGRGRFLRAEIYKGDKLVDKVVFDRRTGRIRSIY